MCGESFTLGEQYVVYAYQRDDGFWTSRCGHNGPVSVALWERYSLPSPIYERGTEEFPKITLDEILQYMTSPDYVLRYEAAVALAYIENKREYIINALREILREERPGDPTAAITAFLLMGEESKHALPDIVKLLEHPDPNLRFGAINALGQLAEPHDLLDYIIFGIADKDSMVRDVSVQQVPYVLSVIDDETCEMLVRKMIGLLDDNFSHVRYLAVNVLRDFQCDNSLARPKLEWLVEHDRDRGVRKSAERTLRCLHH
jgi:HEAT repeat protein